MAKDQTIKNTETEKLTFMEKMNVFLQKNRMLFLGFAIAVLAILLCLFVYTIVSQKSLEASTLAIEKVLSDYDAWNAESDATKKDAAEKDLLASVDSTIKKYKGTYAAQKALLTKAELLYAKKDFAGAEDAYTVLATGYPASYLAPIALSSAAACAEDKGDVDAAIAHLTAFLGKYGKKAVGTPHAYFSLGRLMEGKNDYKGAAAQYEKLASEYPDNNWTKLGKSRIIALKSQGLLQ
jgi:TolA-binding protein